MGGRKEEKQYRVADEGMSVTRFVIDLKSAPKQHYIPHLDHTRPHHTRSHHTRFHHTTPHHTRINTEEARRIRNSRIVASSL
mmetsp:Transcript_13296/g.37444  ORF Transcript_13296/g.37444 Transcript_13296/m.37444 type:complete len:82 (+) Transcript_13296:1519-1764(+)